MSVMCADEKVCLHAFLTTLYSYLCTDTLTGFDNVILQRTRVENVAQSYKCMLPLFFFLFFYIYI
jgi:hypothetical protein